MAWDGGVIHMVLASSSPRAARATPFFPRHAFPAASPRFPASLPSRPYTLFPFFRGITTRQAKVFRRPRAMRPSSCDGRLSPITLVLYLNQYTWVLFTRRGSHCCMGELSHTYRSIIMVLSLTVYCRVSRVSRCISSL